MSVIIKPIAPVKKSLKQYVHFGIDLYKGNKYFVPPLVLDEINTLRPEKNPAFDFCQAQSYMAYRDGKPVGRITGIINRRANEILGRPCVSASSISSMMTRWWTPCFAQYSCGDKIMG